MTVTKELRVDCILCWAWWNWLLFVFWFFFKVYSCFIGWICMGFAVTLQKLHLPASHILKADWSTQLLALMHKPLHQCQCWLMFIYAFLKILQAWWSLIVTRDSNPLVLLNAKSFIPISNLNPESCSLKYSYLQFICQFIYLSFGVCLNTADMQIS